MNKPALALELRANPDWPAAAQVLIDGCAYEPCAQQRMDLLHRLCDTLGPALYPALIGVLCTVGDQGCDAARAVVATTLIDALKSGRLPSGRKPAWGAVSMDGRHMRSLGPVEYLCAWYADPRALRQLSAANFDVALRSLLALFSHTDGMRALYGEHLVCLADDPLGGALSSSVRSGLRQLAAAWRGCGQNLQTPVDAFMHAVNGTNERTNERTNGWAMAPALPARLSPRCPPPG